MDVQGGHPDVLRGAAAAAEAAGLLALGDAEGAVSALKAAARATQDAQDTNGINKEQHSELINSNKRLLELAERALLEQSPQYCDASTQTDDQNFDVEQVDQFNISNTSFHQQSNKDVAQEASAALRRVEDEKEWLTARVKELENKVSASEALDTWALESKLSGTASTQESQAVAMLQTQLDTLKSEMETHIEQRQRASSEKKGMEEKIQTLETELTAKDTKQQVPRIDLGKLNVANQNGSKRLETVSLPSRSLPSSPLSSPRKKQGGLLRAFRNRKNTTIVHEPAPLPPPAPLTARVLQEDDDLLTLGSPAISPTSPTFGQDNDLPSTITDLFSDFPSSINSHFSSISTLTSSGKVLQTTTIQGSLEMVCDTMLSDTFCSQYHCAHGEYTKGNGNELGCKYSKWQSHAVHPKNAGHRTLDCTTIVQAPWSQHTQFIERQRYCKTTKKVILQVSSMTPGVMCGECFRCEVAVVLTSNKDNVTATVTGYVHFMKSPFMGLKSKITSTATSELKDSFQLFLTMLASKMSSPTTPSRLPKFDTKDNPTKTFKSEAPIITTDSSNLSSESVESDNSFVFASGIVYLFASCMLSGICHRIAVVTSEATANFQNSASAAKCLASSAQASFLSDIPLPIVECDVDVASSILSSVLDSGPEVFRALQPLQSQLFFVMSSLYNVAYVVCIILSLITLFLLVHIYNNPRRIASG